MGAIGTAVAQQHLRGILAYLDVPTLGQPEVFIHAKPGFFAASGGIADPGTRKFLESFVDQLRRVGEGARHGVSAERAGLASGLLS